MAWDKISINGVRILSSVTLNIAPKLTLFSGDNGSGKTSILEALCILTTGRSFKSKNKLNLINHSQQKLTVYGEYNQHPQANQFNCGFGLNKENKTQFKINGIKQKNFHTISEVNCLKVITPDVFSSINGKVEDRRNLIDWQLFHVEHGFKKTKKDYKRILSQRNAYLKRENANQSETKDIIFWDEKINEYSIKLDLMRKEAIEQLTTELNYYYGIDKNHKLLGKYKLSHRYSRGWPKEKKLLDLLLENLTKDIEKGYTQYGAHKFDFLFLIDNKGVTECLSRGELKTLAVAAQIAQIAIAVNSGKSVLVLIDDLFAELDFNHAIWCIDTLMKLSKVQIIITGIEINPRVIERYTGKDFKWFHVEHGKIEHRN